MPTLRWSTRYEETASFSNAKFRVLLPILFPSLCGRIAKETIFIRVITTVNYSKNLLWMSEIPNIFFPEIHPENGQHKDNLSFTVVIQPYDADVEKEHAIRGNSVVLKCKIPSFVADFVSVTMWEDSDGNSFYANNDYGITYVLTLILNDCKIFLQYFPLPTSSEPLVHV